VRTYATNVTEIETRGCVFAIRRNKRAIVIGVGRNRREGEGVFGGYIEPTLCLAVAEAGETGKGRRIKRERQRERERERERERG